MNTLFKKCVTKYDRFYFLILSLSINIINEYFIIYYIYLAHLYIDKRKILYITAVTWLKSVGLGTERLGVLRKIFHVLGADTR